MLEKIKSAVQGAKDALLFVVTPLVFVAGYIFYLLTQNRNLKQDLKNKDAEQAIQNTLNLEKEAKHEADSKEADYNTIRDKYIREHGGSGNNV